MVRTPTLVATVLLVPTYVFLIGNANAKEAHLASMRAASSSPDDKAFSSRLTILSKETSILMALANAPSVSEIIRSVLEFSRPGITLSGLTYTPLTAKNPGTVAISGRALTRDALRNYQLALQSAPFARAVALPVSAYAKDADITFTITITLAP